MKAWRLFLCAALMAAIPGHAAQGKIATCIAEKYRLYAKAQSKWQMGFTDFVVKIAPQYKEVANLYVSDQLNGIERLAVAVDYLARNNLKKLRTERPLSSWLELSREDERAIASASSRYGELLRRSSEAKGRPPHPDGQALNAVELIAHVGVHGLRSENRPSIQGSGEPLRERSAQRH